ncbi:MAG: exodeoxyribonuclease VII small subunit [Candidatus Tyrphobacter sp.]
MPEPLQTFEQKLVRIDQIVKELEGAGTDLARVTQLFNEGKTLVRECDELLKSAEQSLKESERAEKSAEA